jgi:protein-tyrosine phosphatase-like protein/uncharacterized protein DUF3562
MTDQVLQMAEDLATEFEPEVPKETVQRIVAETFESLADARIKSYVPILARRLSRDRLREHARLSA